MTYSIRTCFGLRRFPPGSSSRHTVRTATSLELTPSPTIQPSYRPHEWFVSLTIDTPHTFFSRRNLRVVFTRSIPINFPVCHPTGELNSSRWFLSSHWVSLPGGESINEMLNEVKGRRLRVDHPSQIVETFDGIRYHQISESWHRNGKDTPQLSPTLFLQVEFLSHWRNWLSQTSLVCHCHGLCD
jgi:hypothetical protein